jgi:predicted nucleic acid-binding protein
MARKEDLIIPTVVYAELMPQFEGKTDLLDQFLKEHKIVIEPLGLDSVVAAAQAWMRYLKRKGKMTCPQCGHQLNIKKHFLSDFYIGGFASATCAAILTRDRGGI